LKKLISVLEQLFLFDLIMGNSCSEFNIGQSGCANLGRVEFRESYHQSFNQSKSRTFFQEHHSDTDEESEQCSGDFDFQSGNSHLVCLPPDFSWVLGTTEAKKDTLKCLPPNFAWTLGESDIGRIY